MIKLFEILKKGKFELPANHHPGMKVPKGGSCCANCKYWDGKKCENKYYNQWAQTSHIPFNPLEYCSDWWEPKNE